MFQNIFSEGIFPAKKELTDQDVKKGIRMYTFDGICSSGMGAMQGGIYLIAFALAMGASQRQVGFIASIGFLSQIMQLFGLYLVNRFPERKAITVFAASFSRIFWILIILIPFIFTGSITFLLVCLFISSMIGAISGPAWNSLLRDLLPTDRIGQINSRRIRLGMALTFIITLSAGYFVDWWKSSFADQELTSYSILFFLGFIFGIAGIFAIVKIPEKKFNLAKKISMKELLTAPLKNNNFRMLIIFFALWTFAVNMSAPFFMVYMLKRIGLSLFMVTILIVISQLANLTFLKIWGKMADKFSNKSILMVSGPMFLIVVVAWAFTAMPEPHRLTLPLLFILQILSGISIAGVSVGTGNIALKLSPREQAHGYMTVIGLTASVMGALAPITGGIFGDIFAKVQLDIPLILLIKEAKYLLPIINFHGLDFLFLITFLVGIYAIHRLSLVKEEGEVDSEDVIDGLTESIILPLKSINVVAGMQRIAIMPISGMLHLFSKEKHKNTNNKKDN
ncbi:MAG: MFS transporter [Bacteroidota bacterium]